MKRPALPADFAFTLRTMRAQRDPRINATLYAAWCNGWTYRELGEALGFTRQAIEQRVNKAQPAASDQLPVIPLPVKPPTPMPDPPRPRLELRDDMIAQLRELHAQARTVNGSTPVDHPAREASVKLTAIMAGLIEQRIGTTRIAKAIGVTPAAVRFRVGRHGYRDMPPSLQRDDQIYRNRTNRLDLPMTDDEIRAKRAAGATWRQIGEMCGVGESVVRHRVQRPRGAQ